MATTVIDNASLSSFATLLGVTCDPAALPIKALDTHIASAESVIESFLLCDEIVVPRIHRGDYPDTVGSIHAMAGAPLENLRWLDLQSEALGEIENAAQVTVSNWAKEDVHFAPTLAKYGGFAHHTEKWDVWVRRVLDEYDWHWLETASGYHFAEPYVRLTERRRDFPEIATSSELAAALWLTTRTLIYDTTATLIGASYSPHPLRSGFWKATQIQRVSKQAFTHMPVDILTNARAQLHDDFTRSGIEAYELYLPPFLAYVLETAPSPRRILDRLVALRDSRGVRRLRKKLGELQDVVAKQGDPREARKVVMDFHTISSGIAVEWGLEPGPKISPQLQFMSVGVGIEMPVPSLVSRLLRSFVSSVKPHQAFLRDVFSCISRVWSLSSLLDKHYGSPAITSSITPAAVIRPALERIKKESVIDAIEDAGLVPAAEVRDHLASLLRKDEQGALLVADVDDLDYYNRLLGHASGDAALSVVGNALRTTEPDLLTRVSGDTFIAVYARPAHNLAERVDQALADVGTECRSRYPNLINWKRWKPSVSRALVDTRDKIFDSPDDVFRLALKALAGEKLSKRYLPCLVRTSDAGTLDRPTEPQLLRLVQELDRSDRGFLELEPTPEDSSVWRVRISTASDGYQVEIRDPHSRTNSVEIKLDAGGVIDGVVIWLADRPVHPPRYLLCLLHMRGGDSEDRPTEASLAEQIQDRLALGGDCVRIEQAREVTSVFVVQIYAQEGGLYVAEYCRPGCEARRTVRAGDLLDLLGTLSEWLSDHQATPARALSCTVRRPYSSSLDHPSESAMLGLIEELDLGARKALTVSSAPSTHPEGHVRVSAARTGGYKVAVFDRDTRSYNVTREPTSFKVLDCLVRWLQGLEENYGCPESTP